MENTPTNKPNWSDEFGANYFDSISRDVVDALSLLDDRSWRNEFLPRFVVGVVDVSNVHCELFAYVGFDMDADGGQDKTTFTFSLSATAYGSETLEFTEEIQGLFPNINPSCSLSNIELLKRNNAAIVDFIHSANKEFPAIVVDFLKRKLDSNTATTKG